MRELRYALLSDGGADRALLRILTWVLREHLPDCAIQPEWADLRRLPVPLGNLNERIDQALLFYPCDLLFVHRDAETRSREERVEEIRSAHARCGRPDFPAVCVVPVRMTEAWLLFDESAIRRAAGNPNGRVPLRLPGGSPETVPDPKDLLHTLLIEASELTGRRRRRFRPSACSWLVAQYIRDFRPLRGLAAFDAMEAELCETIRQNGW